MRGQPPRAVAASPSGVGSHPDEPTCEHHSPAPHPERVSSKIVSAFRDKPVKIFHPFPIGALAISLALCSCTSSPEAEYKQISRSELRD